MKRLNRRQFLEQSLLATAATVALPGTTRRVLAAESHAREPAFAKVVPEHPFRLGGRPPKSLHSRTPYLPLTTFFAHTPTYPINS